jgi:hypothetical protein
MDSDGKEPPVDIIITEVFELLIKNGTLQYVEKEISPGDNTLLIIKHRPLDEVCNVNEDSYINEQYDTLDLKYQMSSTYDSVLFLIIFCSVKEFRRINKILSLEARQSGAYKFLWTSSRLDKEFMESLKEFIFPAPKPAKKSR